MYDTRTARQLVDQRLDGARRHATDRRRTRSATAGARTPDRHEMTGPAWLRRAARPAVAVAVAKPTIA